ncbi:MAG: arsenic resistance N-acetyltransferase ArsN2 [Bacteroidota bacterium]
MTVKAPDRLGEVLALLTASGLPTDDLAGADPSDFRVVERAGRVVGCVAVEAYGGAGLLRSLAVAEGARGEGLGGVLVEAAEALACERRLGALYLLTTTAAPFFEARGYAPVDRAEVPEAVRRSAEFCSVCPASAACLGKRLSP